MNIKSTGGFALFFLLFACHTNNDPGNATVKIALSKDKFAQLANKYLYLFDESKKAVLDSALVRERTVVFTRTLDTNFVPYPVSVMRVDSFKGRIYLRPLGFKNPYKAKTFYSIFYLDRGLTTLTPMIGAYDTADTKFSGSPQNEPYFREIELDYVGADSAARQSVIAKNISKIKAYPGSIYLLTQLFRYKDKFSIADLKAQLPNFTGEVAKTPMFKSFEKYFSTSANFDAAFPQTSFENPKGEPEKLENKNESYHLVVYWASWCGPCRKEIPYIKELQDKFASRGLSITSISIDGMRKNWYRAMAQEKMPWQQLLAIDSSKEYTDLHYDIKAVPKSYLFDGQGNLVRKFEDGDGAALVKDISGRFENVKGSH